MPPFHKILVKNPIVELEGDEMTRVIWSLIKSKLILPFLSLPLITFDLSLPSRDLTSDQVTLDAVVAMKQHKVGVKCATITPDVARMKEFNLKKMWPSPNGTIRNLLNGVIFREPVVCRNIPKLVPSWKKPIIVARHGFGDQYNATDLVVKGVDRVEIVCRGKDGEVLGVYPIHQFGGEEGVVLGMFNKRKSIEGFAEACFKYARMRGMDLYFSSKNTILKRYDGMFKEVFDQMYEEKFKKEFKEKNIQYTHRLIDDMVAQTIKSEGGFVWACKNYDGDVQSDIVAQGFGSLGMMTSLLYGEDDVIESEAAHGTITRHYRLWEKGEETSSNSVASILAWTRGLEYRGKLDGNKELEEWGREVEREVIKVIEEGWMTKDLALIVKGRGVGRGDYLNTEEFIDKVAERVREMMEKKEEKSSGSSLKE